MYKYSAVEFLGYIKLSISLIKYIPQAYLNYQRQSTIGWSITNILLDLTGGSLSFAQQFVDVIRDDWNWSIFTNNVVKLLLALESVGFDLLFILQHYVLYRGRSEEDHTFEEIGEMEEEEEVEEQAAIIKSERNGRYNSVLPS